MIVGMMPMAIGGPGEEQNAVLARAVLGGVAVGTMTTLFFVPFLYSIIGRFERQEARSRPMRLPIKDRRHEQHCPPDQRIAARPHLPDFDRKPEPEAGQRERTASAASRAPTLGLSRWRRSSQAWLALAYSTESSRDADAEAVLDARLTRSRA